MIKNHKGVNLLEVMIAAGLVSGIALLVSSYVVENVKGTKDIQESASCSSRLQSMVSSIKSIDNNNRVIPWLPASDNLNPNTVFIEDGNLQRFEYNMLNLAPIDSNVAYSGDSVGFPNTTGNHFRNIIEANKSIARNAQNWQLVQSASTRLLSAYQDMCAEETLVTPDPRGDVLQEASWRNIGGLTNPEVRAQVQLEEGQNLLPCTSSWNPVIQNNNPLAPTTHNRSFRVNLKLSFLETDGNTQFCETSFNVKPGRIPNPPGPLNITWSITSGTAASAGRYACGSPSNRPTVTYNVSGITTGSQVLCRVDYAREAIGRDGHNNTGWFVCGLGSNILGSPIQVSAGVNQFDLSIENLAEGFYRLHVMEIDVARNVTITSGLTGLGPGDSDAFDFGVDLYRPLRASPVPPSGLIATTSEHLGSVPASSKWSGIDASFGGALFQCEEGSQDWTANVVPAPGSFPVTPDKYGIRLRVKGDTSMPNCDNTVMPTNIRSGGNYEAVALACDGCGPATDPPEIVEWITDFENDGIPSGPASTLDRPVPTLVSSSAGMNGTFVEGASGMLPTVAALPTKVLSTDDQYELKRADLAANISQVIDWAGMPAGCTPPAADEGGICYQAMDGCGRITNSPLTPYRVRGSDMAGGDKCEGVECAPGFVCDKKGPDAGKCKAVTSVDWLYDSMVGDNRCFKSTSISNPCENDTQNSSCLGDTYKCMGAVPSCPGTTTDVSRSCSRDGESCSISISCEDAEGEPISVDANSGTCAVINKGTCQAPDASPVAGPGEKCPIFSSCGVGSEAPTSVDPGVACTAVATCTASETEFATMGACNLEFGNCEERVACRNRSEENSKICGSGCLASEVEVADMATCTADVRLENCTDKGGMICATEKAFACTAPQVPCEPGNSDYTNCEEVEAGSGFYCGDPACPGGCGDCQAGEERVASMFLCTSNPLLTNCITRGSDVCAQRISPSCTAPRISCSPGEPGFASCSEVAPGSGIYCGEPNCPSGTAEGPIEGFNTNCQAIGSLQCCEPDPGNPECPEASYNWQSGDWSSDYDTCTSPPEPVCGPGETAVDGDPQAPINRSVTCIDGSGSPAEEKCCAAEGAKPASEWTCRPSRVCESTPIPGTWSYGSRCSNGGAGSGTYPSCPGAGYPCSAKIGSPCPDQSQRAHCVRWSASTNQTEHIMICN